MTIHQIKIFDKDMKLKQVITEEQAEAHFYKDCAPSATVRQYLGTTPKVEKKCEFCGKKYFSRLSYAKYCRDMDCASKRDRARRTMQYAREKAHREEEKKLAK